MFPSMLAGSVDRNVTFSAQYCSVLFAEQIRSPLLTDIAERREIRGRMVKREAIMFAGELVGMVDGAITGVAESSFVGGTDQRGLSSVTHVTKYLHSCLRIPLTLCP